MTITLNGTTGITNDGGYTGDGVVFADATPANTLVTTTGGNVGIGTSSPASKLDINGAGSLITLHRASDNSGTGKVGSRSGSSFSLYNDGGSTSEVIVDGSSISFNVGATERARIDSSGNLLVGTTSAGQGTKFVMKTGAGPDWGLGPIAVAPNNFYVVNTIGTGVFLTNGNTAWTANSDERLKTTLQPFENAAAKVCSLRTGTGRYLTDDEAVSRSFLIAQDVQAVLPEAVTVQEDEIGTLGLQYTDTIPLLVAAIQEQQAIITALTARVEALEGTQP